MTTLVTGATGNVGHAIVEELLSDGRTVRALVRSTSRARELLPDGAELVEGDITDPRSTRAAMAGVEHVFHAAGLPEQWQSDPTIFERVNVGGTRTVIDAALAEGVATFVYTSTIDVFEWPAHGTFDESRIDGAPKATHYERSKQAADRLVVSALDTGLPARFVHPSGVYGPAPTITPGVNRLLVGLATNQVPMLLPSGLPAVHSVDCARLHLAAEGVPVGSRYIASGPYVALDAIARAVQAAVPRAKVPRVMPAWMAKVASEAGELISKLTGRPPLISRGEFLFLSHEVRPDSARAQAELGWTARPFEEGVRETIDAMRAAGQLET